MSNLLHSTSHRVSYHHLFPFISNYSSLHIPTCHVSFLCSSLLASHQLNSFTPHLIHHTQSLSRQLILSQQLPTYHSPRPPSQLPLSRGTFFFVPPHGTSAPSCPPLTLLLWMGISCTGRLPVLSLDLSWRFLCTPPVPVLVNTTAGLSKIQGLREGRTEVG